MHNEDDLMDESSPGDRGIWNRNRPRPLFPIEIRILPDFWSTMQNLFGTDLLMSTAYHPQTRTVKRSAPTVSEGDMPVMSKSVPNQFLHRRPRIAGSLYLDWK